MTAGRIGALIVKELLAVLRDKRSRIVLVGPPLIQLLVFSFAATLEVKNVSLALLNQDNGAAAWELVQRLQASPTFTRVRHLRGAEEIAPALDAKQALLAVRIPPDFSRRLARGRPTEIQVILDGRRSNAAHIVQGYVARIVETFTRDLAARRGVPLASSVLLTRHWFNPNLNFIWYTVPSLVGILTMVIGLVVTALSVARERELGTFDQLLVSPLTPTEILIGKTVPALIIGAAEGSIILFAGILLFGVPMTGSIALLYAAMVVFLAAVIGVGLFISSLSMTQQQALLGAFVFMVPAVLLSGFASPIENMPDWLQPVTWFNPLRHFLVIVQGVFLKSMPADIVFSSTWPMAVIALFTLIGAGTLFRRRLE
jgi:ABC-2 type transport system permease protein